MRVKNILLGIIFTMITSVTMAQENPGLPVSMYEIHEFKIIKGAKNFLGKQEGLYTCWANVIQTIFAVHGEKVAQKDIIMAGMILGRKYQIPEFEYKDFIDTSFATLPRPTYHYMLNTRTTVIRPLDVEESLNRNYAIVYMSNMHTSFIVGYSKDYYLVVDSYQGKFEKIPKSHFQSTILRTDVEQDVFLTVNPIAPLEILLTKNP